MKKEVLILIILILLVIGTIANLTHLRKIEESLSLHTEYAYLYCSLEDYEAAHTEITKALNLWLSSEGYTDVFIRQSEVDVISDLLYDTLSAISQREKQEAEHLLRKLQYHIHSVASMERISLKSVF